MASRRGWPEWVEALGTHSVDEGVEMAAPQQPIDDQLGHLLLPHTTLDLLRVGTREQLDLRTAGGDSVAGEGFGVEGTVWRGSATQRLEAAANSAIALRQ